MDEMNDPRKRDIPEAPRDRPSSASTELQALLNAATGLLDEDLKHRERQESGLRAELAVTGTIFAVVQAAVIALINGVLAAKDGVDASDFVPWLAGLGAASTAAAAVAVVATFMATRSLVTATLSANTILSYSEPARHGNPAVTAKLIADYTHLLEYRRRDSVRSVPRQRLARAAMVVAVFLLVVELSVAFVAATQRDRPKPEAVAQPTSTVPRASREPADVTVSPTATYLRGRKLTVRGTINRLARGAVRLDISFATRSRQSRVVQHASIRHGSYYARLTLPSGVRTVAVSVRYDEALIVASGAATLRPVRSR